MSDHYPELLADLRTTLAASLLADGIDEDKARRVSHNAAETIRKAWGGQMIYIGKGYFFELSARDEDIWAKFTGHNHKQLCRDYEISLQWLYKIIKSKHAEDVKKRQIDIFG